MNGKTIIDNASVELFSWVLLVFEPSLYLKKDLKCSLYKYNNFIQTELRYD